MKFKMYLSLAVLSLTVNTASWAATVAGFTMIADTGSSGVIDQDKVIYGQKNIQLNNGNVVQINGKNKTVLFENVVDLSASVSGLTPNNNPINGAFGTFTIAQNVWDNWNTIYIGLKQADAFAIFELTNSILSGRWQTPSGNSGNYGNGLSHYIAFGGELKPPSEVPVPAAVWLFGSAIAGMVGFTRKKSKV